jgi:ArsR family transcriptional regulator
MRRRILGRGFEGKRTLYSIKDPQIFEIIKAVDVLALKQISQLAEAGKVIGNYLNKS